MTDIKHYSISILTNYVTACTFLVYFTHHTFVAGNLTINGER